MKKPLPSSRAARVDLFREALQARKLRVTKVKLAVARAVLFANEPLTTEEIRIRAGRALEPGYKVSQPSVCRIVRILEGEGLIKVLHQTPTYAPMD